MTDREMYEIYRKWILEQTDSAYRIEEKSEDEIDFVTDCAVGHVQFYHLEYEICALTIESEKADEPLFFLHFEIKDLDHAKELFTQMIASLKKAGEDTGVKVLLSCTSGFTTSFFAEKLNGAAQTLGLDYDFSAVPYTDLFEAAMDKDVIMLAPQIGYLLKKAQEVLKDKIIIQIPADVFATYNVTRTVDLIKEADDGTFFRFEKLAHRKKNDNFALDIRGMSNSTSTLNARAVDLLAQFGYAAQSHWSMYARAASPQGIWAENLRRASLTSSARRRSSSGESASVSSRRDMITSIRSGPMFSTLSTSRRLPVSIVI